MPSTDIPPELNVFVNALRSEGFHYLSSNKRYVDKRWEYAVTLGYAERVLERLLTFFNVRKVGGVKIAIVYPVLSNGSKSKPFVSITFSAIPNLQSSGKTSARPFRYGKQ